MISTFLRWLLARVGRQHVLKCLFHHLLLFGGVRLHTGCDFLRLLHAMIFIGIYKIKKMYQRIKILTAKNKKPVHLTMSRTLSRFSPTADGTYAARAALRRSWRTIEITNVYNPKFRQ